jgi:hypothetical protein
MSETTATLREKIIKAGTWTFLVFIFAIIVFSFGMPDVLGTKSKIDAYNAAKVGNDYLTKGEVSEYQKRLEERMAQNMKGLDEKSRKMFDDMTRGRALDEAIDRKIFTQLLSRAGYVPTSSTETKVLANFYKKQFSEYIVNGKLDTERLNEFLSQRRLSLDQIGRNMLQEYGPAKAYEMLQAATYVSDFATLDELQFASTQNSYRIVAVDGAARDKALRAKYNPTEKEIQDKFKAEFLSKDAKAVLDASKRDTIKATMFSEKRSSLEKEFTQSLAQAAKSGLGQVAALASAKIIAIDDAGLSTDLDSKKGKDSANITLSPLAQSDVFMRQRLSAPVGQIVGPVDAGGTIYYFSVVNRKSVPLPAAGEYATLPGKASEAAAKVKTLPKDVTFEKVADNSGKTSYAQVLTAALEIHRSNIRIIRYNQTLEKAE